MPSIHLPLYLHVCIPPLLTAFSPYSHTPILPYSNHIHNLHSVIILAFVKSQGKDVKGGDHKGGVSETTALLSEQTDSLEGSLRDKVVRTTHSCLPSSTLPFLSLVSCASHVTPTPHLPSVPQLQREKTASIQGSADDKLTFSPPSSRSGRVGGGGRASWEEEDIDFSWVDRLGVWPRRILYVPA